MSRSKWKGPYVHQFFLRLNSEQRTQSWSRSTTIVPSSVGKTFDIYNGQRFIQVKITNWMIGHKFGEFSHTRKNYAYVKAK
jgi:small subunit ribosomal protein S19